MPNTMIRLTNAVVPKKIRIRSYS